MKSRLVYLGTIVVIVAFAVAITACGSGNRSTTSSSSASLSGEELLNSRCSVCHSVGLVTGRRGTSDEWDSVVTDMIRRGARLDTSEKNLLIDYLAKTYGR